MATMLARRSVVGSLPFFDLLLWAFILAGLVLRLWRLDAMEFKADEFNHMVAAYRAAHVPWSAPLLGAHGTTVSLGSFFYQFLALPVSVTQNPVSVTRFIALVNIAAIPALFMFIRQFFTAQVALWTTALFATSPWMIIFSRKIWNPDLVIPFLIITLWFVFSAMRTYAPWKVYAFAGFLALLSQMHLSVWLAAFPLLLLGLALRPWRKPFDMAAGIIIFLFVYIMTLGARTSQFMETLIAALAEPYGQDSGSNVVWLASHNGQWWFRLASGMGFEYLLGMGGYAEFAQHPVVRWARVAFLLYAMFASAAAAYVIHRLVKATPASFPEVANRVLLTLLVMAGSLHVLYLMFGIASFPHYQIVLLLLPSLAVALLLVWIAERFRIGGLVIARTFIIAVLAVNVAFSSTFLTFITEQPEAIQGDYGQPYFVERERWRTELEEAFMKVDRETETSSTTAASIQSVGALSTAALEREHGPSALLDRRSAAGHNHHHEARP